jgi:hypothetical protein
LFPVKQTVEIRAVEMVRNIRDAQADELAKKSAAEIIEFFNRAGARAKKSRRISKRVSPSTRRLTKR